MLHKEEERIHIRFEECHMRDILIKYSIPMWHCPIFYLKQSSHAEIITCKRIRNQNKRKNALNNVIISMRYIYWK